MDRNSSCSVSELDSFVSSFLNSAPGTKCASVVRTVHPTSVPLTTGADLPRSPTPAWGFLGGVPLKGLGLIALLGDGVLNPLQRRSICRWTTASLRRLRLKLPIGFPLKLRLRLAQLFCQGPPIDDSSLKLVAKEGWLLCSFSDLPERFNASWSWPTARTDFLANLIISLSSRSSARDHSLNTGPVIRCTFFDSLRNLVSSASTFCLEDLSSKFTIQSSWTLGTVTPFFRGKHLSRHFSVSLFKSQSRNTLSV